MEKKYAEYLLKKTEDDYDLIASDYSLTRVLVTKDIADLKRYAADGDRILDLGCGDGRLLKIFEGKKINYAGVDSSKKMIGIAEKKYSCLSEFSENKNLERITAKFQVTDALKLPFLDNSFDKIYSISVLHHIPSEEFRLEFLKEARRVLKPNGILILRVWNLWPRADIIISGILKGKEKSEIGLILKFAFLKILRKSKLDFKDIFLFWKNSYGKILIRRYIHCFTNGELKALAEKAGLKTKKIWIQGKDIKRISNIYLIAGK